jgi:hypothetical protein
MRKSWLLALLVGIGLSGGTLYGAGPELGTPQNPIVDSRMSEAEAFDGLAADCPKEIRDRQVVVAVTYLGFDGKHHRGQLVVDRDLAADVSEVFQVALAAGFSVQSVIPISHPKFRGNGAWSDDLSMAANNTSGFNYRNATGRATLSNHAYGRAIDLNPFTNPYVKGDLMLPPGSRRDPTLPGALTADHPVTKAFLARGWSWGGNWEDPKDYQHFEKVAGKAN